MNDEQKLKIKVIEMPKTSLFTFESSTWGYNRDEILVNGQKLNKTFEYGWYQFSGKLKNIQQKVLKNKKERWELKDETLYNEKIPLVIDGNNMDNFRSLTKSDIYEYKCEQYEEIEDIPFEIVSKTELKDEVIFDTKIPIEKYDRYGIKKTNFLIKNCTYSFTHKCLVKSPLLELTCPVLLDSEILFDILNNLLKQILNYDIVKANFDTYSTKINSRKYGKQIFQIDTYTSDKTYNLKPLYANNINELQEKILFLANDIKTYVENEEINQKISYFEYNVGFEKRFMEEKGKKNE